MDSYKAKTKHNNNSQIMPQQHPSKIIPRVCQRLQHKHPKTKQPNPNPTPKSHPVTKFRRHHSLQRATQRTVATEFRYWM